MASSAQTDKLLATIINQLGDSANYADLLRWLGGSFDNVDDILAYISNINIYNAEGVWLDLIGDIVGQSREIPDALVYQYFGYVGQTGATGYGQARYRRKNDPITGTSILADEEYRKVILARIARNYGDISEVGVVTGIQNIINTDKIFIETELGGGAFRVFIGANIDSNTEALLANLDIIPRGAGIGITVISTGVPSKTFGYQSQGVGFAGYGVGSYAKRIL